MLKRLLIKDYAIIRDVDIEFGNDFNIVTGETGSGKSLIFDALNIALGDRASSDLVRRGQKKAIIEAEFKMPPEIVNELLNENEFFQNGESIIFRKEFTSSGQSRAFLNDSTISTSEIRKLSSRLLDYHGQNAGRDLLDKEQHINILDLSIPSFSKSDFKENLKEFKSLIADYQKTLNSELELKRNLDFWEFQLSEINSVSPEPCEFEELENELSKIENYESLFELSKQASNDLYESESSAYSQLSKSLSALKQIAALDSNLSEMSEELENNLNAVSEIYSTLNSYAQELEFDPNRIEEVRDRLLSIKALSKKYGSIDEIFVKKEEFESNINLASNFDLELKNKLQLIKEKQIELGDSAYKLSQKRIEHSKILNEKLNEICKELGMEWVDFDARIERQETSDEISSLIVNNKYYSFTDDGIDNVEFYLSTNKGEKHGALQDIVSGGELSRIMLALKSIIAGKDGVGTIIFDEADTGISGRVAQKTGKFMKSLAEKTQIISITHLPQVAAFANNHYLVSKFEDAEGSFSQISLLNEDQQHIEIAKLFSGEELSESALLSAKKLMEN